MINLCVLALWLDPVGGIQSALDPAGPQAARIERLWWLMFWVTLVVFVLVIGTLSISIARRRRSQPIPFPPKDKLPAEKPIGRVIAAAIALTIITLFVLLVASVVAGKNQHQSLASTNPVSIQVIGHQWWWEVRYTSPQADQTIITANEIHVPVGVPININTSSRDVIHSFWAPNVNGKRDLIPGYSTAFWFQADTARIYRGQCAEFCGLQHAHMSFYLVAETPQQFEQWKQQQLKSAPEPDTETKKRGQGVFLSNACVMCHTIRGTIAGSRVGPDLTHVASRQAIAAGTLPNTRGNIAGWIVDPQHIKPGVRMPPSPLSPDDLNALLDYMETLK
jgi:cytochrome c oxidase subunit 2